MPSQAQKKSAYPAQSPKRAPRRDAALKTGKTASSREHSAFGLYLQDISKTPLLSPDEELDLGRTIQSCQKDAILRMHAELEKAERNLTPDDVLFIRNVSEASEKRVCAAENLRKAYNWKRLRGEALMTHVRKGMWSMYGLHLLGRFGQPQGIRAAHRLYQANLRLVVSMARRLQYGTSMSLADLIQEGNIGLDQAVIRFDHRRGLRFSTYAAWWISHALRRAIADKGREIRLPVHLIDGLYRIQKKRNDLTRALRRDVSDEELAEALKMPLKRLQKSLSYSTSIVSLDAPAGPDVESDSTLYDRLAAPTSGTPKVLEAMIDDENKELLQKALKKLKPIERDVIRLRFGFDDETMILREIGEKYHLSRERIRQIQNEAIKRLRHDLQRMTKRRKLAA